MLKVYTRFTTISIIRTSSFKFILWEILYSKSKKGTFESSAWIYYNHNKGPHNWKYACHPRNSNNVGILENTDHNHFRIFYSSFCIFFFLRSAFLIFHLYLVGSAVARVELSVAVSLRPWWATPVECCLPGGLQDDH